MKRVPEKPLALRERNIANRVNEALRNNYHPLAVDIARNQLSYPMPVVYLYSEYNKAFDMPDMTATEKNRRDLALNRIFLATIHFVRFGRLPDVHAAPDARPSREDAIEAA